MEPLRIEGDELGPARMVWLREPRVGLEGFVVIDNTACGPAIGGVRMATDVSVEEVARLARAMTLKNAAAGLPHGGAKAGIVADPRTDPARKEALIRAFARAIAELTSYIPGPDMGTDEACMAWVHDEIGRSVGLPSVLGGIPLDEIGATGFGLAVCAEAAAPFAALALRGARVAVQGFGAVGRNAARFLVERGARLVAASDSRGALCNPQGLDVAALIVHKRSGRPVAEFAGGRAISDEEMSSIECEIWIPAARPDVLRADNVARLRTRMVLQGANIPVTPTAERWLYDHDVLSVPDFIANAGGVICAAVEYQGGDERTAFERIEARIAANTRDVLESSRARRIAPREAATALSRSRVEEAMHYRRA